MGGFALTARSNALPIGCRSYAEWTHAIIWLPLDDNKTGTAPMRGTSTTNEPAWGLIGCSSVAVLSLMFLSFLSSSYSSLQFLVPYYCIFAYPHFESLPCRTRSGRTVHNSRNKKC